MWPILSWIISHLDTNGKKVIAGVKVLITVT